MVSPTPSEHSDNVFAPIDIEGVKAFGDALRTKLLGFYPNPPEAYRSSVGEVVKGTMVLFADPETRDKALNEMQDAVKNAQLIGRQAFLRSQVDALDAPVAAQTPKSNDPMLKNISVEKMGNLIKDLNPAQGELIASLIGNVGFLKPVAGMLSHAAKLETTLAALSGGRLPKDQGVFSFVGNGLESLAKSANARGVELSLASAGEAMGGALKSDKVKNLTDMAREFVEKSQGSIQSSVAQFKESGAMENVPESVKNLVRDNTLVRNIGEKLQGLGSVENAGGALAPIGKLVSDVQKSFSRN